eukprot:IDg10982t1
MTSGLADWESRLNLCAPPPRSGIRWLSSPSLTRKCDCHNSAKPLYLRRQATTQRNWRKSACPTHQIPQHCSTLATRTFVCSPLSLPLASPSRIRFSATMARSGTSSSHGQRNPNSSARMPRRQDRQDPSEDSMSHTRSASGSEPQIRAIRLSSSPGAPASGSAASGSAHAQPPTPHRLARRGRSARSRATLSSASPMFSGVAHGSTVAAAVAVAAADAAAAASGSRASRGVGALYALAGEDKTFPPAPGPCACVLCARARLEWSFGSDRSGWGWGTWARQGVYAVPANCPVALALDTVCARTLADFVSVGAGVDALPLYKLHVRRTIYLLSAAGAAAARA